MSIQANFRNEDINYQEVPESQESQAPSIVGTVSEKIYNVAEKMICPIASELIDWGTNSFEYFNQGMVEAIRKAMLIPGTESYFPVKKILLLQKINLFVVTHPAYINETLEKLRYGDTYSGGKEFCILGNYIGKNSPLTEEDREAHKKEHNFANKHQFSVNVLKEKTHLFHVIAKNFIEEYFNVNETDVFNISQIIPKYPIQASTKVIFNLDHNIPNIDSLLLKAEGLLNDSILYHLKSFIPECIDYTKKQSREELESIVHEIREYSNDNENFIKKMLDHGFNENVVTSMIKTILIIGSGTTKSTLISAVYCLLKNPRYQEKLYQNFLNLNISPDEPNDSLNAKLFNLENSEIKLNESQKMAQREIENFLLEVMRMHAPIPVQARQNKEDLQLGDIKIKKGSTLFLANYLSYTDPQNWENPNQFNPSRFEGEEGEIRRKNFRPFNWGHNICMGRNFAKFTLTNFIYHLVMTYKIEMPLDLNKEPIDQNLNMSDAFTYTFDKDVYVRLVKR